MTTYAPGPRTVALLLLAGSACAPAARAPAASAPQPRASSSDAMAQADSVRRSYTAADVQFMTHMIGHHVQAIEMARWAPTHGANPSVRILAERIINAQQDEIATIQRWLRDRKLPVPEAEPVMLMPGMLTGDQMQQLDAARGPAFDRLFLTFMIQHHNGALTMVERLFGSHGAAQEDTIFKFASDVSADQSTEVARMQTMLAAM
ncbi:MAG: DUF305 domain-containing protein [Gemmatimonadales bacterium]